MWKVFFSSSATSRFISCPSQMISVVQTTSNSLNSPFDLSAYPLFIDQLVQDDTYGTGIFVPKPAMSAFGDEGGNFYEQQWESFYDSVPIAQTATDYLNKNSTGSVSGVNIFPSQFTVPFHLGSVSLLFLLIHFVVLSLSLVLFTAF